MLLLLSHTRLIAPLFRRLTQGDGSESGNGLGDRTASNSLADGPRNSRSRPGGTLDDAVVGFSSIGDRRATAYPPCWAGGIYSWQASGQDRAIQYVRVINITADPGTGNGA